jgi:hypothetical protein
MKRVRRDVVWNQRRQAWVIRGPASAVLPGAAVFQRKWLAVRAAALTARAEWRSGQCGQVVIHRRDGRILDTRTYGKDPRQLRAPRRTQ